MERFRVMITNVSTYPITPKAMILAVIPTKAAFSNTKQIICLEFCGFNLLLLILVNIIKAGFEAGLCYVYLNRNLI